MTEETKDEKPMRMEVPPRHKLPPPFNPAEQLRTIANDPHEEKIQRPSLRLRRILTENAPPEPVGNHVKTVEERVKAYEDMKHKMWRRRIFGKVVDVVIMLLALLAIWYVYMIWRSHTQAELDKERARLDADVARQAEIDRLRAEEREKARKENEERREKIRQEKLREENERKQAMQSKKDAIELYGAMIYALRENDFDIFGRNVTNDLAGSGIVLCYLLPTDDHNLPVYCAEYSKNETSPRIMRLMPNGEKTDIDTDVFTKMLANKDYLVAKEGKVYFKSRRKNPKTGNLSKTRNGDPSEQFFGSLATTLQQLKPTYDELTYDIVFTPKDGSKKIVVENLEFGCSYHIEKVKNAIATEYAAQAISSGTLKLAKYKRTTKLYNGSMIKRGVDGITYVPRTQPAGRLYGTTVCHGHLPGYRTIYRSRARFYNESDNWSSLYAQAQREEEEEKAFYEAQKRDFLENKQRKQTKAEQEWAKKLNRIFEDGSLTYSIRKMIRPE